MKDAKSKICPMGMVDGAMLYDSDIEQVKAVIRKARGEQ